MPEMSDIEATNIRFLILVHHRKTYFGLIKVQRTRANLNNLDSYMYKWRLYQCLPIPTNFGVVLAFYMEIIILGIWHPTPLYAACAFESPIDINYLTT